MQRNNLQEENAQLIRKLEEEKEPHGCEVKLLDQFGDVHLRRQWIRWTISRTSFTVSDCICILVWVMFAMLLSLACLQAYPIVTLFSGIALFHLFSVHY